MPATVKTDRRSVPRLDSQDADILLPSLGFLTDQGIHYCAQNKIPVYDLVTFEGRKRMGFRWESLKPPAIQRLVSNLLVSSIDIQRCEFLSKRQEIFDLTKILIYGFLYTQFKQAINKILLRSDLVEAANKVNVGKQINGNLNFNPKAVTQFLIENDLLVKGFKASLLFEPYSIIAQETKLSEKEKVEKRKVVGGFVDAINNNTWFLLNSIYQSKQALEYLSEINQVLCHFVRRTLVADYTSLILLELIQNAERAHLTHLAHDQLGKMTPQEVDGRLLDNDFRESIVTKAERKRHFMNLSYQFEIKEKEGQNPIRLQITLINKGTISERTRRVLEKKTRMATQEQSLATFYKEADKNKNLGSGLGLYYLSFLDEFCTKEKIEFGARIVSEDAKDQTVVLLYLDL